MCGLYVWGFCERHLPNPLYVQQHWKLSVFQPQNQFKYFSKVRTVWPNARLESWLNPTSIGWTKQKNWIGVKMRKRPKVNISPSIKHNFCHVSMKFERTKASLDRTTKWPVKHFLTHFCRVFYILGLILSTLAYCRSIIAWFFVGYRFIF